MNGVPVLPCAGIPVAACTPEEAVQLVVDQASAPLEHGLDVHLLDTATLAAAVADPKLGELLRAASIILPSDLTVAVTSQLLNGQLPLHVGISGATLLLRVVGRGRAAELRHFLVGRTWQAVDELQIRLRDRLPGAVIAGVDSPRAGDPTDRERDHQAGRIRRSGAQIVWIGLPAPHAEVAMLAHRLPIVAVGMDAVNFAAVTGPRTPPPAWAQHNGLGPVLTLGAHLLCSRRPLGTARFLRTMVRHW